MSKSTGKSVEEIAAERFGSLESLKNKIKEASSSSSSSSYKNKFMRPDGQSSLSSSSSSYRKEIGTNWRKNSETKNQRSLSREKRNKHHRSSSRSSSSSPSRSSSREKKKKHKRRSSRSSSPDRNKSRLDDKKRKHSSSPVASVKSVELKREEEEPVKEEPKKQEVNNSLNNLDLNELGAKLIKAEMMDDEEMIAKIKKLMEAARSSSEKGVKDKKIEKEENKVLIASRTDRFGNEMPIRKSEFDKNSDERNNSKKNKKLNQYSNEGKIDKYFVDDDKYSLKDLVEREKQITADDNNYMYSTMKTKVCDFFIYL